MKNNPFPILFTIPNFITAGSGSVMFNILTRLDRNRYTAYVCVSHSGKFHRTPKSLLKVMGEAFRC